MNTSNLYEQITWAEYKTNLSKHSAQTLFIKDKNLYCIKTSNGYVITNPQYTYCPFTYESLQPNTISELSLGLYLFSDYKLYFYNGDAEWTYLNESNNNSLITINNKHDIYFNGRKLKESKSLNFTSGLIARYHNGQTIIENDGVLSIDYNSDTNLLLVHKQYSNQTFKLSSTSTDTWRPIYVGGRLMLDETPKNSDHLSFVAGNGISFDGSGGGAIQINASGVSKIEKAFTEEGSEINGALTITADGETQNISVYHLPEATDKILGGVRLWDYEHSSIEFNDTLQPQSFSTIATRYYAIESDLNNGQLFVNVPWTDSHVAQQGIMHTSTNDNTPFPITLSSRKFTSTSFTDRLYTTSGLYATKKGALTSLASITAQAFVEGGVALSNKYMAINGVSYDSTTSKLTINGVSYQLSTSGGTTTDTNTWRPIYIGDEILLDDEVDYINSSLIFAAGGGITLTSEHGSGEVQGEVITISTSYASSTGIGGIKLISDNKQTVAANNPSTTANRTYALQLDSANHAVVNVPWTDSNVRQNYVANDAYYPLLGSASNITISAATLGTVNKFANIYANKTGLLVSNKLYIGDLQGAIEDRDLNFDPSNMNSGELYADIIYESHTALSNKYMSINGVSYDSAQSILTINGNSYQLSTGSSGSDTDTWRPVYIKDEEKVLGSETAGFNAVIFDADAGLTVYQDQSENGSSIHGNKIVYKLQLNANAIDATNKIYPLATNEAGDLVVNVPWTDKKVEQKVLTSNTNITYPILLSGHDTITNQDWTDYTYKTNNIYATPGGKLSAVEFAENGSLLSNKYMAKDGVSYDSANSILTINGTSYQLSASGGTTTDTNTWRPIYVGSTMQLDGTTNTPIRFQVGQGISLTNPASTDEKKNFKFELKAATQQELGGIKLGSGTVQTVEANTVSAVENRTYAVQKNSTGQAVVNVPWQSSSIITDVNATDMFDFIANSTHSNACIRILNSGTLPTLLLGVPLYIVSDDQGSTFYYGERTYDFDLNSDTYDTREYYKYELRIYPDSVLVRTIVYNERVITDSNYQEYKITTISSAENLDVSVAELESDDWFNCTIYFAE